MVYKTTAFLIQVTTKIGHASQTRARGGNCHDYGAQDAALRQQGVQAAISLWCICM